MHPPHLRTAFSLAASLLVWQAPTTASAQAVTPPAVAAATTPTAKPKPARSLVPPDINGYKTIIAPPAQTKPVKVAIYQGKGAGQGGVESVTSRIQSIPGAVVTVVSAEEIGTIDLKAFDVVVFGGGAGSAQSKSIGDAGRNNVREYVRGGGGYVGICAGAYLACANFSWGLGLINAGTVSNQWRRGGGMVDLEVTEPGRKVFGDAKGVFKVRYNNGPIIKPGDVAGLPPYTALSLFRSELAENGTPVGVMIDSPAQAISTFGKGRVYISSPHAENTPGLENVVPRAVLWASGLDGL